MKIKDLLKKNENSTQPSRLKVVVGNKYGIKNAPIVTGLPKPTKQNTYKNKDSK